MSTTPKINDIVQRHFENFEKYLKIVEKDINILIKIFPKQKSEWANSEPARELENVLNVKENQFRDELKVNGEYFSDELLHRTNQVIKKINFVQNQISQLRVQPLKKSINNPTARGGKHKSRKVLTQHNIKRRHTFYNK
jgi:hypothetical protein